MRLVLLLLAGVLAVSPAIAGPGRGGSIGSRGSRTYVMPPATATSRFGGQPIQRTVTPPPYATPRGVEGRARRHPFASAFLGGLLGVGLAHLLFGHGLLGILVEVVLLILVVRWLLGRLRAGGVATYVPAPGVAAGAGLAPLTIGRGDYAAFEATLREVCRAWTMGDMAALGRVATPEMVGIFGDEMRELARRGLRNSTTDVRLEKGDLAEAWREGAEEFATVAMRFSAVDIDTDATGRVMSGDPAQRATRTEYWTFVRRANSAWLLSAIQQG